jgi:cytosine/adenosine deaminase-related metal-dependent hydrolase
VSDIFDERYDEGILEELPVDEPTAAGEGGLEAAAGAAFALRGCVLTPEKKLDDGYVVISGSTIASVGTTKPDGVKIVDTEGVILPGLIDLHGHPEYNVFAAWEPPKEYVNRHAWRGSKEYALVVKEPWKKLTAAPGSLLRELTRYAEVRALVGGVTAIQGASAKYPGKDEALVRNVDLPIFGRHRARSVVDLDRVDEARRKSLRKEIDDGRTTAVYMHLAEGKADNKRSQDEFGDLVDANLLTEATVIIHGTALTDASLGDLKDAKGKLVWSPQSNLRLYGQTTPAAKALDLEIPMGLGADWLPSGSQSLLAELSVARRTLARQGKEGAAVDKKLVRMVTSEAAEIAGLGDELGKLEDGRPADVLVLERHYEDPWENVLASGPQWVELVTIGGDLAYGRADWVGDVADAQAYEPLIAWGKQMLLDTSFKSATAAGVNPGNLAEIRKKLLGRFAQTGPIFA